MATKLKNFDFGYLLKTLALCISVILALSTAISGLTFLRMGVFFASEDGKIKNSPAFATEIRNTVNTIESFKEAVDVYADGLTYADYVQTSKAKKIKKQFEQKEKRAIKLFNAIQDLKKIRPRTIETKNGTYIIDDNGVVYFPETGANIAVSEFYDTYRLYYYYGEQCEEDEVLSGYDVDNVVVTIPDDKELFTIKENYPSYPEWNYKYQQLRSAIFDIVDNAVSVDGIKDELNLAETEELLKNYYTDIEKTDEIISSFVNVKFILKNNETGNVISNVEKQNRKSFVKNLAKDSMFYIDFDGNRLHSEPNRINRSTNILRFLTESGTFESKSIDEKYLNNNLAGYSLYLKIDSTELLPGDIYYNIHTCVQTLPETDANTCYNVTILLLITSIIGFIFCCTIFGKENVHYGDLTFLDRIPFVICLALTCVLVGFTGIGIIATTLTDFNQNFVLGPDFPFKWTLSPSSSLCVVSFGAIFIFFVLFGFVLYIIRNIKTLSFGDRFFSVWVFKKIKAFFKFIKTKLSEREFAPEQITKRIKIQTIIFFVAYILINAFFYILSLAEVLVISTIALVVFNAAALVYAFMYINDVTKLAKIAEEIRNGNYTTVIDTQKYIKPLRPFASDLSACRDGIENAINEAIKGEHLKTELITNVSHDLKTPLTSIINYVSLLKIGNIDGEEERKYVEILDEKANKLKRLIEDLTEASKASSGNIKMNVVQVNLNELAVQAVGENSDVLENAGLDIILTEKEKDIIVNADSQHTFRIIDNLFSNAKKYSLTGTRVYVDVYKDDNFGVFEIKNISREKLNINPQELTERFVRGDNSRTTDGSGLGLSIAQSFTELQNGVFDIDIDGDMFKVIVKLPLK